MTALSHSDLVAEAQSHPEEVVHVDHRGDRAIVRLDDPGRLNALSAPLTVQLKARLLELAADPDLRAIVITGTDPGFSAGGDLEMMENAVDRIANHSDPDGTTAIWRWIRYEFGGVVRLIARTDKAFVAAINGPAAGVGLAFALTCDLALASDRARIVPAFGRLGLIPEVGTSWALTRRLGYQGAFAFYAGGRQLDAEGALAAGLVHEVHPHDELPAAADAWCDRIAALPTHAIAMAKPLLRAAGDASWEGALAMEEFAEPACFTTHAFAAAVRELAGTR